MLTNPEIEKISIGFFLEDGSQYANRHSIHVPAIGDEVRFKNVVYKIGYRIWIYDEKYPRVALQMEKVTPNKQIKPT